MGLLGRSRERPEIERADRQKKHAAHQSNQQMAANLQKQNGPFSREYLDTILQDDHNLSPATLDIMAPMLNRTWKLAYLSNENDIEFKWLKRLAKKKIFAAHPRSGSPLQGEYRKFVFDDPDDGLKPLTWKQRHEIDQALMRALADQTRSKQMEQQEQIGKTTAVSEHREPDKSEEGGIFSF